MGPTHPAGGERGAVHRAGCHCSRRPVKISVRAREGESSSRIRTRAIRARPPVQGMRRSVREHPSDVRTALIGCLLVFCFESMQGHQGAASAHASSGSNLIASMCLNCRPKSWRESELGAELYSAFSGLNLQSLLFLDRAPIESSN